VGREYETEQSTCPGTRSLSSRGLELMSTAPISTFDGSLEAMDLNPRRGEQVRCNWEKEMSGTKIDREKREREKQWPRREEQNRSSRIYTRPECENAVKLQRKTKSSIFCQASKRPYKHKKNKKWPALNHTQSSRQTEAAGKKGVVQTNPNWEPRASRMSI
jgi:hypothetical protein